MILYRKQIQQFYKLGFVKNFEDIFYIDKYKKNILELARELILMNGLIPIVGVPVPMLSYGGTAVISLCAAMGLVFNARRKRDIKLESFIDA